MRHSCSIRAALSVLYVASGCTAVSLNQPRLSEQKVQPFKAFAAKDASQPAPLLNAAALDALSPPRVNRPTEIPRSEDIAQMRPVAEEKFVVGKVNLSSSLSMEPTGRTSRGTNEQPSTSIRLAQNLEPAADTPAARRDNQVQAPQLLDETPSEADGQALDSSAEEVVLPVGYALSLGNVLYLVDAQNPNVAFARERINEAYARVDRAEALWLPSIRAGLNYVHHEGNVQDVVGNVFETNKSSLYGGFGAGASGGGTPAVPGLAAQFHFADAIFQPKITGHQATSRQFGAAATRNDVLRNTAVAYLELLRSEQSLAISEEALTNVAQLVKLTGDYARTGQGLRSDYERMLAEQSIRKADVFARVEAVRVASARLAQLLHSDPSLRISSGEPMVIPLDLVDRTSSSASFVATGLQRRPELAEQKHLVAEAVQRLNREKYAPLVPSVLLGLSYGGMGGGLGSSITNTRDRWDADALAYWEIRNIGVGEMAARNEMSSVIRQAQHREVAVMDQVAREVAEAHVQVLERERRISVAKQGILAAERSFRLNEERIENAQGLPIESLQAVQALAAARLSYLNAVTDYNIAQFELTRAIGWFEGESTPQ